MLPTPEQLPTASDYRQATIELDRLFARSKGPRETIERIRRGGLFRTRSGREFMQRVYIISGIIGRGESFPAWSHAEGVQATARAVQDGMVTGLLFTNTLQSETLDEVPEHLPRINRGLDTVMEAARCKAKTHESHAALCDQLEIAGRWGIGTLGGNREVVELWESALLPANDSDNERMVQTGMGIVIDADFASREALRGQIKRRLHSEFSTIVNENRLTTSVSQFDWDEALRKLQEGK